MNVLIIKQIAIKKNKKFNLLFHQTYLFRSKNTVLDSQGLKFLLSKELIKNKILKLDFGLERNFVTKRLKNWQLLKKLFLKKEVNYYNWGWPFKIPTFYMVRFHTYAYDFNNCYFYNLFTTRPKKTFVGKIRFTKKLFLLNYFDFLKKKERKYWCTRLYGFSGIQEKKNINSKVVFFSTVFKSKELIDRIGVLNHLKFVDSILLKKPVNRIYIKGNSGYLKKIFTGSVLLIHFKNKFSIICFFKKVYFINPVDIDFFNGNKKSYIHKYSNLKIYKIKDV